MCELRDRECVEGEKENQERERENQEGKSEREEGGKEDQEGEREREEAERGGEEPRPLLAGEHVVCFGGKLSFEVRVFFTGESEARGCEKEGQNYVTGVSGGSHDT